MIAIAALLASIFVQTSSPAATQPAREQPAAANCPAVVVPRRAVVISAPRDGIIESIPVALGQSLKAGELVAVLESRSVRLELESARVELTEAQGHREKASIQLTRAAEVCQRQSERPEAFTEKERRDAEADRKLAAEELRIAEARIERQRIEEKRLEDLLERSRVAVPFDGTIAVRYIEAGAGVVRGAALARLISSDDLMVRFAAPADRARELTIGSTATFQPPPPAAPLTIRISRIAPEVDPDLQAVVIEADLLAPTSTSATQPVATVRAGLEGRVGLN